jgi:hypothetical protein
MKFPVRILVAASALALGTTSVLVPAAHAGPTVRTVLASEDAAVASALRRADVTLERRLDDQNRPYYRGVTPSGLIFFVYYYGSGNDPSNFMSIQFSASWDIGDTTVEDLNRWNTDYRWLKAYVADGSLFVTSDISLVGGVSEANLTDWMSLTVGMLDEFNNWLPNGNGGGSGGKKSK